MGLSVCGHVFVLWLGGDWISTRGSGATSVRGELVKFSGPRSLQNTEGEGQGGEPPPPSATSTGEVIGHRCVRVLGRSALAFLGGGEARGSSVPVSRGRWRASQWVQDTVGADGWRAIFTPGPLVSGGRPSAASPGVPQP